MCYNYINSFVFLFVCLLQSTPYNHLFFRLYIYRVYTYVLLPLLSQLNNIEVSNSGNLLNKYVDSINVIYVKFLTYILSDITCVIIGNPQYNELIASACNDNLIFDNAFNKKY